MHGMHTATSKVEILSQVLPNKLTFFRAGNPYRREMLSTNDLLIAISCFVKKKKYIDSVRKTAVLNLLVTGGHLYQSFPFSKDSLLRRIIVNSHEQSKLAQCMHANACTFLKNTKRLSSKRIQQELYILYFKVI
jgi:hypothetical protein